METTRRPVGYHDAVGVGVGDVHATFADRNAARLVETAHPGRDTARGAIDPAQRIVVGIADDHATVASDGDSLRVLKAHRIADAVDIAEVEQAGADDGAHTAR